MIKTLFEFVASQTVIMTLFFNFIIATQVTFTCSKSTKETLEGGVKYVQN